jgi:dTDP-glucose 4,6-dehydratase
MSKILITGTSGFIASELIPKLVEQGHDLYGIARYVTGRTAPVANIQTFFCDLRDGFAIRKIVREVQPDICIHVGAMSRVSESYEHPQEFVEANLLGTINLAESCLREVPQFKQFLFAATSEMFGNNGLTIQYEDSPREPASPYAVAKVACENYLRYMKEAYEFPSTILIPFNTYGRKKDFHFFVERTISQMLTKDKVYLIDPEPVRDWMYVDDHVNAYVTCVNNKNAIDQTFTFCTGVGVSVEETANIIAKLTKFKGEIIWNSAPKRPTESKVILGDYSKAYNVLGWHPYFNLKEGLELTIKNMKEVLKID